MKRMMLGTIALALLLSAGLAVAEGAAKSWTGEVVDLACYVPKGAKGSDHAGCAKTCVKAGQPMGLLTSDGTVYLLAADHGDGAPYESLKDLAGQSASVQGSVADKGGVKIITVTGAKAAS
jgi:hypothetical protein